MLFGLGKIRCTVFKAAENSIASIGYGGVSTQPCRSQGLRPYYPTYQSCPGQIADRGKIAMRLRVGCAQILALDSRSMNKHPADFAVVCDVLASC